MRPPGKTSSLNAGVYWTMGNITLLVRICYQTGGGEGEGDCTAIIKFPDHICLCVCMCVPVALGSGPRTSCLLGKQSTPDNTFLALP